MIYVQIRKVKRRSPAPVSAPSSTGRHLIDSTTSHHRHQMDTSAHADADHKGLQLSGRPAYGVLSVGSRQCQGISHPPLIPSQQPQSRTPNPSPGLSIADSTQVNDHDSENLCPFPTRGHGRTWGMDGDTPPTCRDPALFSPSDSTAENPLLSEDVEDISGIREEMQHRELGVLAYAMMNKRGQALHVMHSPPLRCFAASSKSLDVPL